MTQEEIKYHNRLWYYKTYNQLIDKCLQMEKDGYPEDMYTEVHHILPKCQGGTNEKCNLVRMPVRYHIVAHMLLACAFPDEKGLSYAVNVMFNCKSLSVNNKKFSSKLISKFREDYKILIRENGIKRKDGTTRFKARTVVCFNKDFSVAKIYYPMNSAKEDGFCPTSIQKHCKNEDKTTYAGYYWYYMEDAEKFFKENLEKYNPDNSYVDPTYKTLSSLEKRKPSEKRSDMSTEEKRKRSETLKQIKRKYKKPTSNIGSSRKVTGPDGTIYDNVKETAKRNNISVDTIIRWIKTKPELGFSYLVGKRKIIDDKGNKFNSLKECGTYYNVSKQTVRYWESTKRHGIKYIYE